jgi:16S rRNA (cytosine1402-N4)-methyltransferase
LFSTSAGDGVEEFVGETSNQKQPDSHQTTEEETTFATNYHAPVMVHECLDALLDCQQGRIRNPNPKLSKKMKKKKKKHRKPKTVRSEAENEASEEITTSTSAPDSDPGLPQPPPLIFVDGTLGGGGHSSALLQRLRPGDVLLGCDVDPNALATASERLAEYVNHSGADRPLFLPVRTNFGDLAQTLPTVNHPVTGLPVLGESGGVDGILLDLGVSSHQIDAAERGFSFMRDGPLDMRMGRDSGQEGIVDESNTNSCGLTAADICNEFDEGELQRIFSVYGDEPRAKTVARSIVQHRPLHTTGGLVEAIASVTPAFARNKRHGKTATCARVFQSLRIVVNNEDGVLGKVLTEACPALLNPGGRLVVMSYHSMEDRATKRIMRDGTLEKARTSSNEKDLYGNYIGPPKPFRPVQKRQKATEDEIARNSRARSAILRVAERLHDGKN